MNTLQSHNKEFEDGQVNESGFSALKDAETYDSSPSVGAGCSCLALLWEAFYQGKPLSLFSLGATKIKPNTEKALSEWCEHHFPSCYREYLNRKNN